MRAHSDMTAKKKSQKSTGQQLLPLWGNGKTLFITVTFALQKPNSNDQDYARLFTKNKRPSRDFVMRTSDSIYSKL